ncbi:hypothetical protein [Streptomyces aurantiogriseus]|uniref:Lipoprotein n=1 Tax=Streptomyces aurantiogriseus TaxID=66870 RepID=A0A918CD14_9ACTN|nr:hypothetical protein [Streptomyces aurantiogriseus]GGR14736.1 hypothetical protein GCM10010251_33440 [Streptomyces aurantiogriseus]
MNHHRRAFKRPPMATFATVTALAFTLSGCSGDEPKREYTVPDSLCGTAINADDLAPFLPAGKKITIRDKSYSWTAICKIVVDDTLIVTTSQTWLKEGTTTENFAYGQTLDTPKNSADEGRFRYSGYEAFGKTQNCVDTRNKQALYTAIQAQGSKHRDAEAMKRLIISFTKAVEKSAECKEGAK